jgi:hypothetical protein
MKILGIALIVVFSVLLIPRHSQLAAQETTGDAVATDALNHEKLAWELAKKEDKAGLANLLSQDFTEITDDGVFDKAGILANLDNLTLTSYSPSNFKVKKIAPDSVLLIFQVTVNGKYKDHDFQAESNAASLWIKRQGQWQNVHFQETPIPK